MREIDLKNVKRLLSVKASAGSGKTFRLANRYIALLNIENNPANIVAITFTNKAANEMKERIIKFLMLLKNENFLSEKEKKDRQNIIEMICNELGINEGLLLNEVNKLIKNFLTQDNNIQTIDSFINKILRKFSFYAGVRSNFEVRDIDEESIFKEFLKSLDNDEFEGLIKIAKEEDKKFTSFLELFKELYEKDKELKYVLENSNWDNVKAPSKDKEEKAKEAFYKLKSYILNSPHSSSRAHNAVNIDFYEIPYQTWFSKNSLKEYQYFKKKTLYQEWFDEVLEILQDYFRDYFRYKEAKFFKNLFDFYEKYKDLKWKIKKDENAFSFKDIEHLVYDLLQEDKLSTDFLYFRLDSKVNHILMDEFQDTSVTQWEIAEPIVDEIASGVGRRDFRTFFYVGDTKQAIYRFRGGNRELFEAVAKKYIPFGLKEESLDINFRSAKNIVEFVNEKFDLDEEWRDDAPEGYVEVDEITKEDAFERIFEKIKFLNENGVKDKDIAILVYKNDDILNLAEFLEKKGKKAVTAKTAEVKSQKSAKAIISLMKYLHNKNQKIEKLNFLSLIGKKWTEEDIDIKIDRPVKMIKEIMDKYDLTDEASLKLLYHSQKYDTLEDFVNDIDNYSEELPYKEFDGITIITIHKSKGLEFDNVIVLDRLSREKNNTGRILFYYENAKLKDIKLRFKNREIIDGEYRKVFEKEKELEKEDKRNVEYVAFTRAKNSLIILKKEKDSAFITPLSKKDSKKGKIIPSKDEEKEKIKKLKVNLKNYGKQELKVEEEEYEANDYEAIFLGVALHYSFECEDIEAVRNLYGDYCDMEEVEILYKQSKRKLKKGKKEVPFIYDKKLGRIDLMIEGDEVTIIDYKSTKPKDETKYINQVKHYIEVIKKLKGKKAKGKLFYIDIQEFKEI